MKLPKIVILGSIVLQGCVLGASYYNFWYGSYLLALLYGFLFSFMFVMLITKLMDD